MSKKTYSLQQLLQTTPYVAQTAYCQKVLHQLQICRTAANGYHLYKCTGIECSTLKFQYHSCRNRHCPQCGALQKKQWIEQRQRELLPVPYYHTVFTLPHELNSITLGNRSIRYRILFKAAATTLLQFAADKKYLGAQPGILAVLHTCLSRATTREGQQLSFHPHLHCIVSGGGIAQGKNDIYWKNAAKNKDNFLFPVKAMSKVYKAIFLKQLQQAIAKNKVAINKAQQQELPQLISKLYQQDWVVYAKKPFGGPQQVIKYLAAYTNKVAISNHRIISHTNDQVSFTYKDYKQQGQPKKMTLAATEFLRRFEQHILPKGFTKIRSYGYLANKGKTKRIGDIVAGLKLPQHPPSVKTPWYKLLYEYFGVVHN
jgi:hypothetical protein